MIQPTSPEKYPYWNQTLLAPNLTLILCISVQHPDKLKTKLSIKNILLSNDWCVNIEPTKQEGKNLPRQPKSDIDEGRNWLDANLPPNFHQPYHENS